MIVRARLAQTRQRCANLAAAATDTDLRHQRACNIVAFLARETVTVLALAAPMLVLAALTWGRM